MNTGFFVVVIIVKCKESLYQPDDWGLTPIHYSGLKNYDMAKNAWIYLIGWFRSTDKN